MSYDLIESNDSQAFKHVFTSPSSVDKEPKATRSGNARIHGMRSVTAGSIAYIATQVRLETNYGFASGGLAMSGSLRTMFLASFLSNRHDYRLRKIFFFNS